MAQSYPHPPQKIPFLPQPILPWTVILLFSLVTALGIFGGAGKILNLAFPGMSFILGIWLYFRYPLLYHGYTWWIWFLTAFIRRLADYYSSYTEPSPLLLAPFLVSGITFITFLLKFPRMTRQGGLPFVLAIVGVFYGSFVGLLYAAPYDLARSLLDWLPPVTFGFHIFSHWRHYPIYRRNIQRVFVWGILLMGVYGIYQFIFAPEWDILWITSSGMITSQGDPVPFGLRVWSTMQSVEPFTAIMAAGLLMLFSTQSVIRFPAALVGYLSFLLSQGRSGWFGWLSGLLVYISYLKSKHQIRTIVTIALMVLCVIPLATMDEFSEIITERLATFSNLEEDGSASQRQDLVRRLLVPALTNWFGNGIGNGIGDNGLLSTFFQLGWFGVIFYAGGMFLLIFQLFKSSLGKQDLFLAAVRAGVMSIVVRLPLNNVFWGVSGLLFWELLALGLAAHKYHLYYSANGLNIIAQTNNDRAENNNL